MSGVEPPLRLHWRPFRFSLARPLLTARATVHEKRGWLLRLEGERCGWGEAAPLEADPSSQEELLTRMAAAIADLPERCGRAWLEQALPVLPPPLGFAVGAALAEQEGRVGPGAGGWQTPPPPALLLPAGEAVIPALEQVLLSIQAGQRPEDLTVKWKVAAAADALERRLLETVLEALPPAARLRLDANGGWDRRTARDWADRLAGDPRLEWLEQPLAPRDLDGLEHLARRVPVALDESLQVLPALRASWSGWQVRRPALEGDPRLLLGQLEAGGSRLVLSTAFETGIGARLVGHLAALQARGPTPAAPGLAPGWCPPGPLFSPDPGEVWEAA
jgi:O-succinylbenzoate synthase